MSTHSFDTEEAKKYGTDAAVLLSNIRFWLQHNKANKTQEHDGFYWTFNSAEAFAELFPYMNRRSISRHLKKLSEDGVIKISNYNKVGFDRTQWYTIPSEFSVKPLQTNNNAIGQNDQSIGQNDQSIGQNDQSIGQNDQSIGQNVPTIPDINTDFKTQIENKREPAPEKTEKVAKEKPVRFVKPTIEEIRAYCVEASLNVDCEKLYDHYEANGWMVGKLPMKDWKATVRNWARREGDFKPKQPARTSKPDFNNLPEYILPEKYRTDPNYMGGDVIDSTVAETPVFAGFLGGDQ